MSNEHCSKEELIKQLDELRERNTQLELYIKEKCTQNYDARDNADDIKLSWEAVERAITEEALRKSRLRLEAELEDTKLLQSISMELLSEGDIQSLYERIIDAAMHIMRSNFASMQMIQSDDWGKGKLRLLSSRGFGTEALKFWEWVEAESSGSTSGEAFRRGHRVIASNVEKCDFMRYTEDREMYLRTGIRAVQTTTLYSRGGNLLGMISTHWRYPHQPSERELRLLDLLARQAADLIEQKQSEEKLRASEEKYRNLFEYMNEGFFLAEMIYDEAGTPMDYLHLAMNPAMDRILGLERNAILGKTRKELLLNPSPWIEIFHKVAQTGESVVFEGFSEDLKRHFHIRVFSPKQGLFACLVNDITERRKLEGELKYNKELFESVIENMHDALVICTKEGKTIFMNAEARRQYGNSHNHATSDQAHNDFEFFDMEQNLIKEENLPTNRVFSGEKIRNEKIIVKCSSGIKYTEINATPIFDENNNLTSAVVAHRDITQFIEYQQKLKKQQDKLLRAEQDKRETIEAAMKVKDEFLYLITHEFKTPIAVISSVLQTIDCSLKEEISEKLDRYLNMIKINTNRQLRLVNNLLDITKLNSGYMKINNQCVDIVYMSKAIVNSVEPYAEQKQIELSFTTSLKKKEILLDEEKFERIMLNLLSNALKFTPKGKKIEVLLSAKRCKSKHYISVSVRDEGIGIPFDRQQVIFERFGQADTSFSRQAEGTGLGLHLVNLLVKKLEGEIILESEIDKGSTFTILLPAIRPQEAALEVCCCTTNELMSTDERIIQAASVEFSDIYFD